MKSLSDIVYTSLQLPKPNKTGCMNMRVLLTGHLGYIGTVLAPMLVDAGHDVVGMDSDLYSRCTFAAGGAIREIQTIRIDTRDASLENFAGICAAVGAAT